MLLAGCATSMANNNGVLTSLVDNDYFTMDYMYYYDAYWGTSYEAGPNEENDHFSYESMGVEFSSFVNFTVQMTVLDQYELNYMVSFIPIQGSPLTATVTWYRPEVAIVRMDWDFNLAASYEFDWFRFVLTTEEGFKTFEASFVEAIENDEYDTLYPTSQDDFDYAGTYGYEDSIWNFSLIDLIFDTEKPWFFWSGEHEYVSWWVLGMEFETLFSHGGQSQHQPPQNQNQTQGGQQGPQGQEGQNGEDPQGPPPQLLFQEMPPSDEQNGPAPMNMMGGSHQPDLSMMNIMERDAYWREVDPKNSLFLPIPFESVIASIFGVKDNQSQNGPSEGPNGQPDQGGQQGGEFPGGEEGRQGPHSFEDPASSFFMY